MMKLTFVLMVEGRFKCLEAFNVDRSLLEKSFREQSFGPLDVVGWQMNPTELGRLGLLWQRAYSMLGGVARIRRQGIKQFVH